MAIKGRKFLQDVGKRLEELRKAQNLTQAQLAQLLGISQQLVAFYEGGHQRIPIDLLPEVARLLGVQVEQLLGLSAGAARRGPTPKFQQQPERINRLPRSKQRFVMEMLDAVLTQAGA
jgi:transcriptional regulator with XRE-family HTH domain